MMDNFGIGYFLGSTLGKNIESKPDEEEIRKDEREKMLDELTKWRDEQEHFMGMFYTDKDFVTAWKDEWKKIKELRQEGKEER